MLTPHYPLVYRLDWLDAAAVLRTLETKDALAAAILTLTASDNAAFPPDLPSSVKPAAHRAEKKMLLHEWSEASKAQVLSGLAPSGLRWTIKKMNLEWSECLLNWGPAAPHAATQCCQQLGCKCLYCPLSPFLLVLCRASGRTCFRYSSQ